MATINVTQSDRERYARARAVGHQRAHDSSAVVRARYDARRDVVELLFGGGGSMAIPRQLVPGLGRAAPDQVARIEISPAGDAVSWPSLDVDVHVPGLIERVFGSRLLASASGSRGGRSRSKAKIAAAKANGAKGGRPRKRMSA